MPDVDITGIANNILKEYWKVIDGSPSINGRDFCTIFSIVAYTVTDAVATQVKQRPSVIWREVSGVIAQALEEHEQGESDDSVNQ